MPELTINAKTGEGQVTLQDPNPIGGLLAITLDDGDTFTGDITWRQLQSLSGQLYLLEDAGKLDNWSVGPAAWDNRANEHGLAGGPSISKISASKGISFAGEDDIIITGTNLAGSGAKAAVTIGTTANAVMTYTAIVPGADGNLITIEQKTGAGEALGVVSNAITATLDVGVSTGTTLAALVNTDSTAKYMVLAETSGSGAGVADVVAATLLADGTGDGISCTYGGEACVISNVADAGTSITLNTADITADLEGTWQLLQVTTDGKKAQPVSVLAKSPAIPTIANIDLEHVDASAGNAGVAVTTTGIGSGQTRATITMGTGADSKVTYDAVTQGAGGNDITVQHKTGAGEAISVVASFVEVTLNTGTSTGTSIAAAVNGDAAAELLVQATAEGTGGDNAEVVAITSLAGGIGLGVTCTYINAAVAITDCPDAGTSLELDIPIGGTAAHTGVLRVISGSTIMELAIPLVV